MAEQKSKDQADEKLEPGFVPTKSTATLDLEARMARGNEPDSDRVLTLSPAEQASRQVGDYVGVDPIYQNHAEDVLKPFAAEGGAEQEVEDQHFDNLMVEKGREPVEAVKQNFAGVTTQLDIEDQKSGPKS